MQQTVWFLIQMHIKEQVMECCAHLTGYGLIHFVFTELDPRYGLPSTVDRVDAVYERPDHRIVFFVGDVYYVLGRRDSL